MDDLFLTPTRKRLLADIAKGDVIGTPYIGDESDDYWWFDLKVTARVAEAIAAGWAEKGQPHRNTPNSTYPVRLTEAGQQVLEAGRG